jgi:uncharacterized tellurite resistance protein B-like protein
MNKIEQLKSEIERLKSINLKPSNNGNDNYLSKTLEKTKQIQKITESLTEFVAELTKDADQKTQIELNKIIDNEITNLLNSVYS